MTATLVATPDPIPGIDSLPVDPEFDAALDRFLRLDPGDLEARMWLLGNPTESMW